MAFKPGESGNPNGSKPNKPFIEAVQRAIAQSDGEKLRACAEMLLLQAANGQEWAQRLLFERLDGAISQRVSVSGEVAHTVRSVSDLDSFIEGAISARSERLLPPPVPD